jgi:REP element-mobilizing transposase RayT
MPLLDTSVTKETFERELERVRVWYGCYITGYAVMPEHVHLLISEPERSKLSVVIQMLKQDNVTKAASKTSSAFLAGPLLRFFRMDRGETYREAALHPSQSSEARTGGEARGLEVE